MFCYIISETIDYSALICPDAGPMFASSMGWRSIEFSKIDDLLLEDVLLIDPRLGMEECIKLSKTIEKRKDVTFGLCVTDPGEYYVEHWYYQLLIKSSFLKNTFIISKYHPTGILKLLFQLYEKRFIALPFPYIRSKEVLNKRKLNKIIFSGSIGEVYPERKLFLKRIKLIPFIAMKVDVLPHPGYKDIGQQQTHHIVHDDYLNYLGRYKFMFLSGSKYRVELLKFNECGYAFCSPIGIPPDTFPNEIKELFLVPKFTIRGIIQLAKYIFFPNNRLIKESCEKYRAFLRERNCPNSLNHSLLKFISTFNSLD